MNLLEMLYNSTLKFGSKESLRYKRDGRYVSLTYADLWKGIQQFARGLSVHGVKAGDKVALLSNNNPEWVISDYAIQWLSGVVVPIYPTIPAGQVEFILRNADVTLAIVQNPEQLEKVRTVWPEKLQKVILIEGAAQVAQGLCPPIFTFSDIIRDGQRANPPLPDFYTIPETQICSIVHTSGTSGKPKGVMLSHRNLTSNVEASVSVLPVDTTDVSLSYLPLSHIFERTVEEYAMLSTGATVVYAEGIDALQQNLQEVSPTVLVTVPRLLEKVYAGVQTKLSQAPRPIRGILRKGIQQGKTSGLTYRLVDRLVYQKLRHGLGGRMRAVVSGGAGLAKEIAEFYIKAGIPIYEGYGMTEAAPVIAANPVGANRPGTVGQPIPGVEVTTAEDGELLVRGPNVMLGYYNAPGETAATITSDGWLHTGDIAELEPDGYIRIVDRKKNILVLATGKNVAPWPIENNLTLSPYIAEAILIGDGRQYVTCLIVPDFPALAPLGQSLEATDNHVALLAQPHVQRLLASEIARSTTGFAPFERPKRAVLLPTELTLEGGELTPTLKVRNKIILKKYEHLIEDMYNDKNFVAIPTGLADAASETMTLPDGATSSALITTPSGEQGIAKVETRDSDNGSLSAEQPNQSSSSAVHKGTLWKRGIAAAIVVALLAFGGLQAATGNLKMPSSLNLIDMIRTIHGNNNKINGVNSQIIGNMQQISNLSGVTANLGQQLHTLSQGVSTDGQSLASLNNLSQQEVTLSTSFVRLAHTLNSHLSAISSSSQAQNQSVARMLAQMHQLSNSASTMTQVNQSIANQLTSATQKTATVAKEMP